MSYQYVQTTRLSSSTVLVTLKRSEKRNALSLQLMEELTAVFEGFAQDLSCRVAILTAEGPAFCAGLDLVEATDPTLYEKTAQHVARLLTAIYTSSVVSIAVIQGDAIAGGAGITAACDFAIIAEGAHMGFPETRRGLVAAQVATLLRRQMRLRDVRELLLTGEVVDARHALRMGLVNRVVEKESLMEEALNLAKVILQGSPQATRETKKLLDNLDPASFFEDLEFALSVHHSARHSEEAKEGIAAFLEKRLPKWNEDEHASL